MVRPEKCRCVSFNPEITYFKPAGISLSVLEEINLNVEEFEAIRLKDFEGLEQKDCAERMKISQPTFNRILLSARKKIADALTNGKAIRIQGGNFRITGLRRKRLRNKFRGCNCKNNSE
ncbi:MAG: DUF134 domain-containing protein [Candidatus Woesearchaeota archaeon]